jgi:hypothetical protein
VRESELVSRPAAALATGRRWLWLFAAMLALLVLSIAVEAITENPKFIPSILALGAFAVPVAFAFVGSRVPAADVPFGSVAVCFVAGGVVGTAVASMLKWDTLRDLGTVPVILVGGIEEPARLLVPVALFFGTRYVLIADGLVLGVAAGMGFAAFETMVTRSRRCWRPITSAPPSASSSSAPPRHRSAIRPGPRWYARCSGTSAAASGVLPDATRGRRITAAVLLYAGWDAYIDESVKQAVVGVVSAAALVLCVLVARRDLRATVPEVQSARQLTPVARLRGES